MNDAIICDTPNKINAYGLLSLKAALSLEVKGMKASRGFSAFKTVKDRFGFKGTKQSVFDQFVAYLKGQGILKS